MFGLVCVLYISKVEYRYDIVPTSKKALPRTLES